MLSLAIFSFHELDEVFAQQRKVEKQFRDDEAGHQKSRI